MESKLKPLQVDFGAISVQNVGQLKKLHESCFPITYKDHFYKEVTQSKEDLCKFAYWNGFVIGAVCTRIEPCPERPDEKRLYIMTLGVLAPYRGRGVGSKLISSVLDYYESNKEGVEFANVNEVVLHVQSNNQDAVDFYSKKFGFAKGKMIENYYKRVDPPHCYVLSKNLG